MTTADYLHDTATRVLAAVDDLTPADPGTMRTRTAAEPLDWGDGTAMCDCPAPGWTPGPPPARRVFAGTPPACPVCGQRGECAYTCTAAIERELLSGIATWPAT